MGWLVRGRRCAVADADAGAVDGGCKTGVIEGASAAHGT